MKSILKRIYLLEDTNLVNIKTYIILIKPLYYIGVFLCLIVDKIYFIFKIKTMTKEERLEREKVIKKLLDDGVTYKVIGEKFGITQERVRQISHRLGIKRWEISRENKKIAKEDMMKDIEAGLTYKEISKKYKHIKGLRDIISGLEKIILDKRNELIIKEYKTKTAKQIISDNNLNIGENFVYEIVTEAGLKKYPKVGPRYKGGLNEDEEILTIIKRKREVDGMSFKAIASYLNNNGYITVQGKLFADHSVRHKYNKMVRLHKIKE